MVLIIQRRTVHGDDVIKGAAVIINLSSSSLFYDGLSIRLPAFHTVQHAIIWTRSK